jgi:hypothetical protein
VPAAVERLGPLKFGSISVGYQIFVFLYYYYS